MTRKSTTRIATPARRSSILSAALACFTEHGIENTTIQDIQKQAGCSTGSLYHHFGSKEGVASSLFIETFKELNESVLAQLKSCDDAQAGVYIVVTKICEWVSNNHSAAKFLLQSRDIQFPEKQRQALKLEYVQIIKGYFIWFTPFVKNGSMKSLPLDTYIPLITGPVQEYARRWLAGHVDKSPASLNSVFAEAAWNAVRGSSQA